jgi:alginate O-acetyltransferase complex protein AlgI
MILQNPITFIAAIFISGLFANLENKIHLLIATASLILITYVDPASIPVILVGLLLLIYADRGGSPWKILLICIWILIFYKSGLLVKIVNLLDNRVINYIFIGEITQGRPIPSGVSFFLITVSLLAFELTKIQGKSRLSESISTATFFPHILAGPILYKPLVIDKRLKTLGPGYATFIFCAGMWLLNSSEVLNQIFQGSRASSINNGYFQSWIFYLYLFSNFFGYSLLATAYAMLFGVEIPINFNAPSLAKNPSDYWLRWHRSLSLLFRNHVYKFFVLKKINAKVSVVLIMLISGIWHGWGWSFLMWGMLNALLIIFFKRFDNSVYLRIVTFIIMPATWVPFFSNSIKEVLDCYFNFFYWGIQTELFSIKYIFIILSIFMLSLIPYKLLLTPIFLVEYDSVAPYGKHCKKDFSEYEEYVISFLGGGVLALILFYSIGTSSDFVYQRF